MKKFFSIFFIAVIILQSCSSQSGLDSKVVEQLVSSNQFTFMAKRANPTNMDVINVMNSFPASSSSRMLNLEYGYTLVLKDKVLDVTLPYFGRRYNASYDNTKNSYRFTSKDFVMNKSKNEKGKWLITFEPKDIQYVRFMNLEIYPNGNAFLSINGNDRQPISYDGYLMQSEVPKSN